MVKIVFGIGRSGLQDWVLQRVTAIVIASFFIYVLMQGLCLNTHTFNAWQQILFTRYAKVFIFITILAIILHAWIGMWTITTDYLKITWLRLLIQLLIIASLLFELYWGVCLLWL